MKIIVGKNRADIGRQAADVGADLIRAAIRSRGASAIILATGTSQFEMLSELTSAPGIDWRRVTGFHLDEYVGMTESHPSSFRRYLRERFVERLPRAPRAFHFINGENDPAAECRRLNNLISGETIDVAFVGIGENGHLAFNDPPADFETETPYLLVTLDEACRRQQLGEGWFPSLEAVPMQAISMSIRQIMKSKAIVCCVPDLRKAAAVKACIEGPVSPEAPASILQRHPETSMYLDEGSASLLKERPPAV
ncbi:MAG TPA: glucosamine-6-phosphate deaminase [Armatimonadota bacterium]|nr:glucosamine-6-phosphate deaminase [Armatimonadota bacterium]